MIDTSTNKVDLQLALLKDRFALKKLQRQLSTSPPAKQKALQQRFQQLFEQSSALCQMRREKTLSISYPEQLPISESRDKIKALLEQHQVVIVAGETGSGKTTQLPKLLLELGRGRDAMIGHTQPRRIAALAVASRIAEELETPLGQEVGAQIRFHDSSNEHTLLKVMTDGVLLAEIAHDRFLERYDALIIDEAHERSLNIDFLLGYIKSILPKRRDLKVIITSATIDVERFSEYFHQAPIISVSGRSFPVDIVYQAIDKEQDDALYYAIADSLRQIEHLERAGKTASVQGDVLVFLPGEQDIRHCALYLRKAELHDCDILPLYARLPRQQQQAIFQPSAKNSTRRVILATNVAETSLTVPGIHYVIDSGLARISRYSHLSKVQRLPIEKISQASANQRAGRCGRIAKGICFRLYDEDDFLLRDAFTEPEIQRTNLSSVILQMQALRLGDMDDFPFIQAPDTRLINDGMRQLIELAALSEERKLTPVGKQMALLPVDPKLSRILLAAEKQRCLTEVLVIVAALSSQDPREFPADKREASREKHQRFADKQSDFLSYYLLWQYVEEQRQAFSNNQFRRLCQKEFLSAQRIREWRETHSQLKRICHSLGFKENKEAADYNSIHQALLSGLILNAGFQHEKRLFTGTRNRIFRIFPSSYLTKKPPKWIMAAELIETSQLYAHTVAQIEPEWLYEAAEHLLKLHYFEPHFSARQGQVMAWQQASLYGLVIAEKKRVNYAQIDAQLAREIFIRSGLVEEQLQSKAKFYQHNKKLRQSIEKLEEKSRRRDLLISDNVLFDFYQQHIPQHVNTQKTLEHWLKTAAPNDTKKLFADSALFTAATVDDAQAQFPEKIHWQNIDYRLRYRFEPGHPEDGLSVEIPVAILNRVPHFLFDWLVPGMLEEKAEALLKTLPKQYRRQIVPIPDTVAGLMADLKPQDQALSVVLADLLKKKKGISIPLDAWQPEQLDSWYKANIRLLDEHGKLLAQSRDLASLIEQYAGHVQQALEKESSSEEKPQFYTSWDFPDLKKQHHFKQAGSQLMAYPAIADQGDKVSLVLCDYPPIQAATHQQGLIRLAMLTLVQQHKYLRKELLKGNALQLKLGTGFDKPTLLDDLLNSIFQQTFFKEGLVWEKAAFVQRIEKYKGQLISNAQAIEKLLIDIVEQDYNVRAALSKTDKKLYNASLKDIEQQRQALFIENFFSQVPYQYLACYPRYLKAMQQRIERLGAQAPKDQQATEELQQLQQRWQQVCDQHPQSIQLAPMVEYRWLLEEYRVSLFAQQLKTRVPVSRKRLDALWQDIQQSLQREFP